MSTAIVTPEVSTPPQRSLARKIAEITKILKPLERTKEVEIKGEKFKVASQEDVIALVNKEIAERNIAIFPDTVRFDHDRDITRLLVEFTIEDGDSGETRKFKVPGEGQDKADKGASKALSAANKNMLIKLFQIPMIEAGTLPAVEQRKGGDSRRALGEARRSRERHCAEGGAVSAHW